MALIGSVFALAGRFAGRVVNALLGWATILLFGRVEARKQTILGFVAMGSLAWVATLFGILIPDAGTFLVAAVPRPDFVPEEMIRIGMLFAAMVIPVAIGVTGVWLIEPKARPTGVALLVAVLRGYPFTALLALMMAFLAVVAFVRKVGSVRRRWETAHIPLIVKPGRYDDVVRELESVLSRVSPDVGVRPAPSLLSLPPRLLDRVAGSALGGMVPDRLVVLVAPDLEILVYPSDLAFAGSRDALTRARAAIVSTLTRAPAWLTMSKEAQELEDALAAVGRRAPGGSGGVSTWAALDERLASTVIPFEDWETLYRMRLQVERDVLRGTEHVAGLPPRAERTPGRAESAAMSTSLPAPGPGAAAEPKRRREGLLGLAGGVGIASLMVLDVALLLSDRRPRPPPRPWSRG
jgi:hypothetical protein